MKIFVPIKRVPDYQAKIKIKSDGSGIETDGIKWIVNPFDEIAVEEALRIKEAGKAEEVVVASIGPEDVGTQLRYCLAMGADRAFLVKYDGVVDSDLAARLLAWLYKKENFGAIILGKQAIDSDAGQTPQLLATYLNLTHASFASKVELDSGSAKVTREIDGGLETIKITLPAVISTDLRLNEPRYASLPGIMKAKKKPLQEFTQADVGADFDWKPKTKLIRMSAPSGRSAGKKVDNVEALVQQLQNEAKVL